MEMFKDSQHPLSFPRQKISYKKKIASDKNWFKECVESAEHMALYNNFDDHKRMSVLYDLDNDILNEEEMEKVLNPMGLQEATFPASTKNYPLSVPKLDLLQGEELKRRFDWNLRAQNLETESSSQTSLSDMMMQVLIEELKNESFNEDDFNKRMAEFGKYAKYSWKSKNELTGTRILQYLWREQNVQAKFNEVFRDVLVSGRGIVRVDIDGEEPVIEKADPRTLYSIRRGESHKIEDSDIIVQITYEPLNKIIDAFYDELSDAEIEQLENVHSKKASAGGALGYKNEYPPIYSNVDFGNGPGFLNLRDFNNQDATPGLPFDEEGNVRVVRARWVGRKRVGVLTYFDEITGDEKEEVVSELQKPDETLGQSIRYIWINEAYEGTKIANDIFVRLQPRDVQMRHFDNKSKCFLGYVGSVYGRSLMQKMESYQYLYNIYMRRLELIMAKYKGPIYELDISKIPDDWEMDKWMYYADVMGWAVIDNFNESKKGANTGKPAGSFNSSGRVLDPNIGNYIQQVVMMLQYIEEMMGKIAGVNDQRLGQIDNRETVGGVERAVTQSSHITERWFFIHDEMKKRALAALLDTARYAWRNSKSKKLNFVLDDMSRVFLEFNPDDIASTEYDLFVTNSSRDAEIRQGLKQLAHAAVQNGARMSAYADVLISESISDIINKLDAADDETHQKQVDLQKMQQEAQERMTQAQIADKEADRKLSYDQLENDRYKAELDADTKLTIAGMKQNEGSDNDIDDSSGFDEKKHNDTINLNRSQLNETIRHNVATESIARNKPKPKLTK